MAKKTILILARKNLKESNVEAKLNQPDVTVFTGVTLEDVKQTFADLKKQDKTIDHVFIGAGIETDKRLEIVKEILKCSDATSIHLKDKLTGGKAMLPYVKGTLEGLKDYEIKNVLFENTA